VDDHAGLKDDISVLDGVIGLGLEGRFDDGLDRSCGLRRRGDRFLAFGNTADVLWASVLEERSPAIGAQGLSDATSRGAGFSRDGLGLELFALSNTAWVLHTTSRVLFSGSGGRASFFRGNCYSTADSLARCWVLFAHQLHGLEYCIPRAPVATAHNSTSNTSGNLNRLLEASAAGVLGASPGVLFGVFHAGVARVRNTHR